MYFLCENISIAEQKSVLFWRIESVELGRLENHKLKGCMNFGPYKPGAEGNEYPTFDRKFPDHMSPHGSAIGDFSDDILSLISRLVLRKNEDTTVEPFTNEGS